MAVMVPDHNNLAALIRKAAARRRRIRRAAAAAAIAGGLALAGGAAWKRKHPRDPKGRFRDTPDKTTTAAAKPKDAPSSRQGKASDDTTGSPTRVRGELMPGRNRFRGPQEDPGPSKNPIPLEPGPSAGRTALSTAKPLSPKAIAAENYLRSIGRLPKTDPSPLEGAPPARTDRALDHLDRPPSTWSYLNGAHRDMGFNHHPRIRFDRDENNRLKVTPGDGPLDDSPEEQAMYALVGSGISPIRYRAQILDRNGRGYVVTSHVNGEMMLHGYYDLPIRFDGWFKPNPTYQTPKQSDGQQFGTRDFRAFRSAVRRSSLANFKWIHEISYHDESPRSRTERPMRDRR